MRLTPAFRRRWGVLRTAVPAIGAAALVAAAALPVAASSGDEGRHESSSALTVDLACIRIPDRFGLNRPMNLRGQCRHSRCRSLAFVAGQPPGDSAHHDGNNERNHGDD